jgi:flagellin-like protein
MTSRRAISPVIATVILIAVAVALGIAVAVWAGALTGNLQNQEKLIVTAYMPDLTHIVVSITNQSPKAITVSQVSFNNWPQPLIVAAFAPRMNSGATLTTASIVVANSTNLSSGISYPITVSTASGGAYPVTVTAP